MNVLEKILEEILQYTVDVYECDLDDIVEYQRKNRDDKCTYIVQGIAEATEFIRSHMDKQVVFKFDFNRVKSFDCQCGRHYVNTYDGGWIPVGDGLPEEGQDVLAQFVVRVVSTNNEVRETVYIHVLYYENGVWQSFAGVPNGKVEAWQPLPKPYKEK